MWPSTPLRLKLSVSPLQPVTMPKRSASLSATSCSASRACSGGSEWAWRISMFDMWALPKWPVLCACRPMHPSARGLLLDCADVTALRLRFQNREHADLALGPGVHAIGYDPSGSLAQVVPDSAVAQFCVDRRGVWLQVREGAPGLHVNGRPVKRMAMLRVGDAIFVDGVELVLLGGDPLPA